MKSGLFFSDAVVANSIGTVISKTFHTYYLI